MRFVNGRAATLLLIGLASCGSGQDRPPVATFSLTSTAFAEGQAIPSEYSCDGADRPPPLAWSEPPQGTRSFALIVDDPDAPGGIFRHWGIYDIPESMRNLPAGASWMPQAQNDFGKTSYGGPCPPKGRGSHRYRFKLLALDVERLELSAGTKVTQVESKAGRHLLGRAELTGTYERR